MMIFKQDYLKLTNLNFKMFNKLFEYIVKNTNTRTLKYTTGTIAIIYIISNLSPRPPGNRYLLLRKY